MRTQSSIIVIISITFGLAAGVAWNRLSNSGLNSRFDAGVWPSRGEGDVLLEFYDPACPFSRQLDRELQQLELTYRFRRTLIPVDVTASTGQPGATHLADTLCEASDEESFIAAQEYDRAIRDKPSPISLETQGPRHDCRRLVRSTTAHIAQLLQRAPVAPVVQFHGRIYVGLDDLESLARELKGLQ